MKVFVKICGLGSQEDVEAVAALKPDAVGFVFWPKSKRCVAPKLAAEWAAALPKSIAKTGVFVDQPLVEVARAIKAVDLDIVQLHGHEPPELCELLPTRVWKAVRLDRDTPQSLEAYRVDAFLIDSYSASSPGGTGQTVDWEQAKAFAKAVKPTPVVLAGGLTPENVREAVKAVRPWGVDVSSGVEVRPRVKNLELVEAFVRACRKR